MKYKYFIFFLICLNVGCEEQSVFVDLRKNINYDNFYLSPNFLRPVDSSGILNYAKTLTYSYKLTLDNPYGNCITCKPSDMEKTMLAQAFSFVGDNKNAIAYSAKAEGGGPPVQDSVRLKEIVLHDAKEYIVKSFKNSQVIMFNEAHDRVQTRTLLLSTLSDLKMAGATILAMETLNKNGNFNELDKSTGYYTAEPIAGQIVREALRLGYKIVSYEDTATGSSSKQRDRNQAKNLLNRISKKDKVEKTVVLAGYGHISEYCNDSTHKSMAMYFFDFSGINPLTINQVDFIESSPNPIIRPFLEKVVKSKISEVKALDRTTVDNLYEVMSDEKMPKSDHFDIYIFYPNTIYIHNRPDWLLTSNEKDFVSVEVPKNIRPVLIQAYVSAEIKSEKDFDLKIPFDQTFTTESGKAWFVLQKKVKYDIIFRDEKNMIVLKQQFSF